MNTPKILSVTNLVKSFHIAGVLTPILHDISLDIYEGEFVAIMGKSGAGKSTLLYQMSLLDTPTSGSVVIQDQSVSDFSDAEKSVFRLHTLGFVFQDYALIPELTARENIELPLLMQGMTQQQSAERAMEVLTQLSLESQANKLPSKLSGGQQQRVSIARAVALHPAIIFADEPTANLDSVSSSEVMDVFRAEHSSGRTIIMVTHEPEYAHYADRIIQLSDGVITSDSGF